MNIPKKYLTETVILVENIVQPDDILKILTQDKNAKTSNSSSDPTFQYYKKLIDQARSGHKQGKKGAKSEIVLDNFKLSKRKEAEALGLPKRATSLGGMLTKLKELMDIKGGYDPSNKDSNTIQITTLELLSQLTNLPIPKLPTPDPDPDPDPEDPEDTADEKYPEGKIDWTAYRAKKLAEAGKEGKTVSQILDEFYELYYRKEYAGLKSAKEPDELGIVDKLKSLHKILALEFNKLGYNPEVNPFAQFLKLLIEHDINIFKKLNTSSYGALHNAFIDKKITGNQLGNFDKKNILFCSDLYNYRGPEIAEYLSLYEQVMSKAKIDGKYANNPELLAVKIFIQQKQLSDDYVENINKLLELKENEVVLPGENAAAKLRSNLEIAEMFQYLFKEAAKKAINDKTIKEIIKEAVNQNVLIALAYYLIKTKRLGGDQADAQNWFKKFRPEYSYPDGAEDKCDEIMSKYLTDDKAITKLFKQVQEKLIEIKKQATKGGS